MEGRVRTARTCSQLTFSFHSNIKQSSAWSRQADDEVSAAAATPGAAGAAGGRRQASGGPFVFTRPLAGAGRARGAKASSDQQKRTNVLSGYRISIGPPRVTESHLKPNFAAHKQGRAARGGGEELFKAAVLQCKERWRRRRRWRLQISR